MSKLAPPSVAYDDPSNTKDNGQPKMGEDAFAIQQQMLAGDLLWSPDFLGWGDKTPTNIHEAIEILRAFKQTAEQPTQTDWLKADHAEADLVDWLKFNGDNESYQPADFFHWTVPVDTVSEAIDVLAARIDDDTAVRVDAIATEDVSVAEVLYSQAQMDAVIALVNELKATINSMNA